MTVRDSRAAVWLLLTFTLPTKRASKRVEVWRKLQRYGTVPLGNSGYLLPGSPAESRAKEYQELIRDIEKLIATPQYERGTGKLTRLRSRFQEIVDVDFFGSPLQKRVAELLASADARRAAKPTQPAAKVNVQDYKNRIWVTRPRPGVDRSASAWLIKRFIDPKAQFTFAPEDNVPNGAVPFDMFHGEGFGHRGDDCTFETLQK